MQPWVSSAVLSRAVLSKRFATMTQLRSDPHAQFAEHPLAPAVVKASGSNYLAQSLHEGASAGGRKARL